MEGRLDRGLWATMGFEIWAVGGDGRLFFCFLFVCFVLGCFSGILFSVERRLDRGHEGP